MLYDPKWEKKAATTTAAEVYSAAADVIEDRGHSKGLLRNEQGAMCLFGAISYVLNGNAMCTSERSLNLTQSLSSFCGHESPVRWNNAPERTKDEVVAVLRQAALSSTDGTKP